MIVISLNEVHVWWKVGCLLGCWIIVGLGFCLILVGYIHCRMILIFVDYGYALGGILNHCRCCTNLPLLHQYYRLKSGILVRHAVHRGTAGGFSEITKYLLFWCWHRYLGLVIGDKGLSLISYHFHLRMPKAGLFPPVKYFLRKSEELFRQSQKYISITSRSLLSRVGGFWTVPVFYRGIYW